MKMRIIGALVLSAAVIAGCQREMAKMVEVTGHIFVFNYRVASATYLVTLRKTAPIPEGAVAIAEFENPAGGEPIVLREKIFPAWEKIALQSPGVHCIRKGKAYSVHIRIVTAEGETLQELEMQLVSDVDQSILPGKPLVVGPLYTKNPEVFKADGSTDYSSTEKCPGV
jgi:hypothetical protein